MVREMFAEIRLAVMLAELAVKLEELALGWFLLRLACVLDA
jgi:hypothetical protein